MKQVAQAEPRDLLDRVLVPEQRVRAIPGGECQIAGARRALIVEQHPAEGREIIPVKRPVDQNERNVHEGQPVGVSRLGFVKQIVHVARRSREVDGCGVTIQTRLPRALEQQMIFIPLAPDGSRGHGQQLVGIRGVPLAEERKKQKQAPDPVHSLSSRARKRRRRIRFHGRRVQLSSVCARTRGIRLSR